MRYISMALLPIGLMTAPAWALQDTAPAATAPPAADTAAPAAPAADAAVPEAPTTGPDGKVILAVGVPVKDPQMNDVGRIIEVAPAPDGSGQLVTVDTGTVKAVIPQTSFALTETSAVIGLTRSQLNEAAAKAAQPAANDPTQPAS